jgi:hypothetical protein
MLYEFADGITSPYIVPVAGTIMILGIVAVSKASEYGTRKLQYEERMTAIAKGLPLPEPPDMRPEKRAMSMKQRNVNIRLAGIICTGGAIAVALFFYMLYLIIGQREILSGAAAALVPFGIGAGLLIDARINSRALEDEQAGH